MQQLTGVDVMFLGLERDENPMNMAGVSVCDPSTAPGGAVSVSDIKKLLQSRQHLLTLLRRRLHRVPLSLDHPYWVIDEDFDLNQHVRSVQLRKPGTWSELMRTATRIINQPFDLNRPLWEIYVIEGLNEGPDLSPGSFALFMRLHHAYADAATAMAINDILFDDSPTVPDDADRIAKQQTEQRDSNKVPGGINLLASAMRNMVTSALHSGLDLARATPHLARYLTETVQETYREGASQRSGLFPPKTMLNPERLSAERLYDARRFDFSRVKAIRKLARGATINDILLAIVSGALRRYLLIHDDLPEETLTSILPINVRKFDDRSDAGNAISGMALPLHQEIADPVERLMAIHKASRHAKRDNSMEVNRRVMSLVTNMPAPLLTITLSGVRTLAYEFQPAIASTIVSNAVSFPDVCYVAGAEVKYMFGLAMLWPGIGSMHGCTVYAGYLNIGLACSPDVIPDTSVYMQCLEESFAEYNDLAAP